MKKNTVSPRGFTLIEILVVIGIIAILAAIVIIAINPDRQFKQANDAQRSSNVNAILNAIGQNLADNKGTFTCGSVTLPTATTTIGTASGYTDLSCLAPTYIPAIPTDPTTGSAANTGYSIIKASSGRISIIATSGLTSANIIVTR